MPDVVGDRLDVAKSDLSAAGVSEGDVEVVGGGMFGVVDESNWTVCEQSPSAGSAASDVRVVVDRECAGGGAETSSDAPDLTLPDLGDAGGDQATLPDAVAMDLQAAQDTMQAAGFFSLTSHDESGDDRFQVNDRSWTVCSQDPPGGSEVSTDVEIDFGVVKDDESCP